MAAFVISLLALVAASASAFFAGRQAAHAKRQANDTAKLAAIEAERRHVEQAPRFDASIESVNGGGWYRLWLYLTFGPTLDSVQLEILNDRGLWFGTEQDGVGSSEAFPKIAQGGALARGDTASWQIVLAEDPPPVLQLRVNCTAGSEQWDVLTSADVPYDVLKSLY